MFAFADPQRVSEVLTAAGWAPPVIDRFDCNLDIAAGRGLEEAVVQSTEIGTINSWLRDQPEEVVTARRRPSARRLQRIWTARAYIYPVRCGWLAASPAERVGA